MDLDFTQIGEPLVPEELYVRPCFNGVSTDPSIFFNFSLLSRCNDRQNCSGLMQQPGASLVTPILLSMTGISGHIIALAFLYCGTEQSKHKTVFYVLLATLIWTDLVGKLVTTPTPIIAYVNGHFVGGVHMCNAHGFMMSLIGMLTHFLVAIMAIERYIGIRHGYFYKDYITTSRTRILLLCVGIFALLFCSLPLFGVGEFKLHLPGTWCHINQHVCPDQLWYKRGFAYAYATLNLLSLFILVVCNLVVVVTLLRMRMTQFRPSKYCKQVPSRKGREREIQMVLVLLIITIVFFFSWAALDLLMLKNRFWPPPPYKNPILDIQAIRLVSVNQIVDPWVYIICQVVFKSRIWKLCRGCFVGKITAIRGDSKQDRNYSLNSSEMESRKQSIATEQTFLKDQTTIDKLLNNLMPTRKESIVSRLKVFFGLCDDTSMTKSPHKPGTPTENVERKIACLENNSPDVILNLLPDDGLNVNDESLFIKNDTGNLSVHSFRCNNFRSSQRSLPGRSNSWSSPNEFSLSSAYRCHSLYTFQKKEPINSVT